MSGSRSRRKGHNAERTYADIFKNELGFKNCMTTRLGSRGLDNVGIDLMGLPIHVQIKAGEHKGMNVRRVMYEYKESWTKENMEAFNFKENPFILIHHKLCKKKGQRRTPYMAMVYLSYKDYKRIFNENTRHSLETYHTSKISGPWAKVLEKNNVEVAIYNNPMKMDKFKEFHNIVAMTFDTFKHNYKLEKIQDVKNFK